LGDLVDNQINEINKELRKFDLKDVDVPNKDFAAHATNDNHVPLTLKIGKSYDGLPTTPSDLQTSLVVLTDISNWRKVKILKS